MTSTTRTHIQLLGIAAGAGAGTRGAETGPDSLRELGLVARLEGGGRTVNDLGNVPGDQTTDHAVGQGRSVHAFHNVLQFNRHTHAAVLNSLRNSGGAFLLIVGGDHSLAIGTLGGLADHAKRLGVLWIDAHADFNTPATSPSGNIHGMSLATACGSGQPDLKRIAARDPMIAEADVHLFGVRDVDPGEQRTLDQSDVHVLDAAQWRSAGMLESVCAACDDLAARCDHIHLSFDIDVLDAKFVPGTGTRIADGITPAEAREVLSALGKRGVLSSAEFVEYNPTIDIEQRTGKLTVDLIEALLKAPA